MTYAWRYQNGGMKTHWTDLITAACQFINMGSQQAYNSARQHRAKPDASSTKVSIGRYKWLDRSRQCLVWPGASHIFCY